MDPLIRIANVQVYRDGTTIRWTSGLAVDADGSPRAYGPPGTEHLDALGNAGKPGDWWGIATDTGKPDGKPIVQGEHDPAPGCYVSTTALSDHSRAISDPRRYVDSGAVPYLSVPPALIHHGVKLGDVALVRYRDQTSAAVVADVGPGDALGEGSIALARALGIDPSPRHGGIGAGVEVVVWLGSSKGWPRIQDEIAAQVEQLRAVVAAA